MSSRCIFGIGLCHQSRVATYDRSEVRSSCLDDVWLRARRELWAVELWCGQDGHDWLDAQSHDRGREIQRQDQLDISRCRDADDGGLLPEQMLKKLDPRQVSPAVAWMCSEECDATGEIIAAGAGYFARVKLVKGAGAVVGNGEIATIEDFVVAKEQIFDLNGAAPYSKTIDDDTRRILGMA